VWQTSHNAPVESGTHQLGEDGENRDGAADGFSIACQ
jgi:hypothetical protein